MGVFNKILHLGEGRKLKALEGIVPDIGAFEPEIQKLSDDQLAAKTVGVPRPPRPGGGSRRPPARGVRHRPGSGPAGARPAPLRRPGDGRGGPPLRVGGRDEDRRGQDPRLHPARLPQRPDGQGRPPGHGQRLPGQARRRVDGPGPQVPRPHRRARHPRRVRRARGEARPRTPATSPTAPTTSSGSTTCATTWPRPGSTWSSGATTSPSSTRSTRSSSTRPARRSSSPGRSTTPPSSTPSSPASCPRLQQERDYEVDEKKKTVAPTEEGITRVEEALGVENLYDNINQNFVHQLQAALRAKELFKRDVDYVVADGEVKIVDEFTGRILEGRRWSEGLHQAVEAKENVKIKEENQTLATITLQNYFRLYDKLSGMTGTASPRPASSPTPTTSRSSRSRPTSR